eukprot:TRINITY_DN1727_c0_g1_i1.p1 TRINITY_DN1727_c0_g1~~TRINITY_DN1727_c0_g1_i1.p1  ORF type:complete len:163 (+),score=30.44 TRINITY_DN1727_c0_g1_i1:144-632(+)
MGNVFNRQLEDGKLKEMADRVFYETADANRDGKLDIMELYVAVLLFYNDLNKKLPGPHNDPPSRQKVAEMMKKFDFNEDGQLDREEFTQFLKLFTKHVASRVGQQLLILCVLTPLVALAVKRGTHKVPYVGKVVEIVPDSVFAPAVTGLVAVSKKEIGRRTT